MRLFICLVLGCWLSSVSAASPAASFPDSAFLLERAHRAFRPSLLALSVWLALPLGRPARLAETGLLTALAASAARDPNGFHNLQLSALLILLVATVLEQRRASSPNFCRGKAHDC